MKANHFPPNMVENSKVILFDGVCKLCNAWSRFIIRYDRNQIFKLASVQSKEGQLILQHFNMPTDYFDTMLYIEGNRSFKKSDAFIEIVNHLNQPWKAFFLLRIFPKCFRDWCYDRIALNRYSLFGKYDQCLLPKLDHEKRFLKNGE
jgi:predicted DCC family thiol-disulfide oxidoreductase YuxK